MNHALELHDFDLLAVVDNPDQRLEIGWLNAVCQDLAEAPKLMDAIRQVVKENPGRTSVGTLKRKYYAWKSDGLAGLVDRRKLKKRNKVNPWVECYMMHAENHNRSNKGGYDAMMERFWAGEVLEHGVGTWRDWWRREYPHKAVPAECPAGYTPKCAAYPNLQRAAKKSNPHMGCQIIASRQGRKAMHPYLLPVLRTRIGLKPGQVIQFDDVETDVETVMPGIANIARPVMFVGYDVASGMKVCSVCRPEYPKTGGKKKDSLKESEFRMMGADFLINTGFHKDGVRLVGEHGTAAFRAPLQKRIKSIPGYGELINFDVSGILAEAIHAGYFKGNGGGNFRLKAFCERMHRLEHSMRSMLPGQVGQDADHRPESHAALVKYNQQVMIAAKEMLTPSEQELIRYSLLEYKDFVQIAERLSDAISDSRNHQLEGWEHNRANFYRLNESDPEWKPMSDFDNYPPEEREQFLAHISRNRDKKLIANLQLTRREVWNMGVKDLIRIPLIDLPMLLDDRLISNGGDAREITVHKNGTFEFQDKFYFGQEKQIFYATCTTRPGFQQSLIPGRKYLFFVTPYQAEGGVIVDRDSGNIIGVAPYYNKAPIYDRQAIMEKAGEQNHDLAVKMMPVRGRHQREAEARLQLIGHNADVFAGRKQPPLPQIKTTATINDLYEEQLVENEW